MLDTLSAIVSVLALSVISTYCYIVANQCNGRACPGGIKLTWLAVCLSAAWLICTILAPLLHHCLLHAVAVFVTSVLVLLLIERRGLRRDRWSRG
jgi:ABC-type Na+ efflux pump permease subunit